MEIGLTMNGLQLGHGLLRELGGCGPRHYAVREVVESLSLSHTDSSQ